MAQMNWNSYRNGGVRNQRQPMPMMNLRQTEGERLHDQALSFYTHGNIAQAELLLNKAIALEPSNNSFRETRNSFSQFPSTYSQQPTALGHDFTETETQRRQFGGNGIPATSSLRPKWDSRRQQDSSRFSNGNVLQTPSPRSPWPQPANGSAAQYISNTVADSMFGTNYWGPSDGDQNLNPQVHSHFGNPRPVQRSNNSNTARTNTKHGTGCNTSNTTNQDYVWGKRNDPGAKSNPTKETTWLDSGYQQSDIPWSEEPQKAVSLPNYSRSSANCSASQGSLRGSMANSAKDHHNKAGRSLEETCSETCVGLDNFEDVSNKVQEWLVRNETSGVVSPPGLAKVKKNKKKKKKTALPRKETEHSESQIDEGILHDERNKTLSKQEQLLMDGCMNPVSSKGVDRETSSQHAKSKTSRTNNAPNHAAQQRTVPSVAKPITNCNSDKLSQPYENPNGSKSCNVTNKPFFDPKRIFIPSSHSKGCKPTGIKEQGDSSNSGRQNLAKRTEVESDRKILPEENRGQTESAKTGQDIQSDQTDSRNNSAGSHNHCQKLPQQTEISNPAKEMDRSRQDSSGSIESDKSGRMTKEEWEEIIHRMYAPLGIPSSISQDHFAFQNCDENSMKSSNSTTFKESFGSRPKTAKGNSTRNPEKMMSPKAGGENTAKEDRSNSIQYVSVGATLKAGILETRVPVCHAGTSFTTSAPAVDGTRRFLDMNKFLRTESTLKANPGCQTPFAKAATTQKESKSSEERNDLPDTKPLPKPSFTTSAPAVDGTRRFLDMDKFLRTESTLKANPGCQTPFAKAATTQKERKSSEERNNLPDTKSLPKPNVEVSSTPLDISEITMRELSPTAKDCKGSEKTRSHTESEVEAPAKISSTQTTKAFWQPSRIFGGPRKVQESGKAQACVSGSGAEANKNAGGNMSSIPQTTALKKGATRKICEDLKKGCNINTKSNQGTDMKQYSAETTETHNWKTSTLGMDTKSSGTKASNSLNNAGVGQTKAVPSTSNTDYSYVAWREQNSQRDTDSVKKTSSTTPIPAVGSTRHNSRSGIEQATGSLPVPKPAVSPTKVSMSQNTDKDSGTKSDTASSKTPSGNRTPAKDKTGSEDSQFQTSSNPPKSTSDTYSTQRQESSSSKNVPENSSTQSEQFRKTKNVPSNKMPQNKPNVNTRESGEPKTKSSSRTAPNSHPFQQKCDETSTINASQSGRPSTHSNPKTSSTGASQGSRKKTSTSSGTRPRRPEASTSRTREDDLGPRQRSKMQDASSEARAAPDELDNEDVDPLYKWTRAIGKGLWWAVCFVIFLLLILIACLYSTLKVVTKYCWHILKELFKMIQEHQQGNRSHEGASGGQGSWESSNHGPSSNHKPQQTRNIDIPTSGGAAIKRLLRCNQDNPYEVLGVSSEASVDDIKKYYRRQCMLVHPDKNDLGSAQEAFQILQRAYETLTDPTKRQEFEMENRHAHFDEEMGDLWKKMEEALNSLSCDVCHGKHRRYEVDRPPHSARYCRKHDMRHPAFEGDVWVETTHLGFKWHYYAMMEDRIFDITEWAACQDMRHMESNACEIRYRVGTRGNRSSSRQRNQPSSAHGFSNHHSQQGQDFNADMTEELFKEFIRQFQQSETRGGGPGGNYGGGDTNNANQDRGRKNKKHRKKKR